MIIVILWISYAIAIYWYFWHYLRVKERFENTEYESWRRIDRVNPSDFVWNAIQPIEVENMRPVNARSHKSGVSVKDLQDAIDVGITKDNFPDVNVGFQWMAYRPKYIPKRVYEKGVTDFIDKTNIKDRFNLALINVRVIHANVTKNDDHFLLTYQIIVNQPSVMYAKAIEFTCLYTWQSKKTQYINARVVGLVHESYLKLNFNIISANYIFQ